MENEAADVCYVIQVDICLCQQNFLWNAAPPLKRVSRQIFHVIARMQRVSQVLSCSNLGKRPISAEQPVFVSGHDVACTFRGSTHHQTKSIFRYATAKKETFKNTCMINYPQNSANRDKILPILLLEVLHGW